MFMVSVSFVMMIIAMIATTVVLMIGLVTLARGGEFARKYSNQMMRLRVFFQAAAVLFFVIALAASGS